MKKLTIGLSVAALLFLGGWYAKQMIVKKVGTEITKVIASPEVQKEINKLPASQLDHMISTSLKTNQNGGKVTNSTSSSAITPGTKTIPPANLPVIDNSSNNSAASPKEHTDKPVAANKEEAIQFAMNRFSTKEIMHYMSVYQNRKTLTSSQKQAIKAEILSRFTPEEIRELAIAAKK